MSISACGVGPCLYVFPKVIQKISVHAYIHTYLGTRVCIYLFIIHFFFHILLLMSFLFLGFINIYIYYVCMYREWHSCGRVLEFLQKFIHVLRIDMLVYLSYVIITLFFADLTKVI